MGYLLLEDTGLQKNGLLIKNGWGEKLSDIWHKTNFELGTYLPI